MRPYVAVFSRQAMNFLVDADAGMFSEVEIWVAKLEKAPSTRGDFEEFDDLGRAVQVVVLSNVTVSYWTDDAEREVRVVGIEKL